MVKYFKWGEQMYEYKLIRSSRRTLAVQITEDGEISEEAQNMVMEQLKGSFRPEFLNRLDETIMFKPLTKDNISSIINLQLEEINKLPDTKKATRQYVRVLTSNASECMLDNQGRILLQKRNLQSINATNELLIVGMMNRFAIWDKTTFESKRLEQSDFAAKLKMRMCKA